MVITDLVVQKKNPNRFNLFIDDSFYCGVSLSIIAKYKLFNNKDLDSNELEKILFDSLYERLLNRVVNYLSNYRKTEKQAREYIRKLLFEMRGDWFEKDMVLDKDGITDNIIEFAKGNNLLNDKLFAEEFIKDRMRNKPKSRYLIEAELKQKGISREIIDEIFGNGDGEMRNEKGEMRRDEFVMLSDEELIVQLCKKKYGVEKISGDDRKKIAFFQRKGFSWEVISSIIDINI